MVFYCKNLEKKIFTEHNVLDKEPDELIIISGYIGPTPVERLKELPFKTTVIGGMYSNGINKRLYDSLKKSQCANSNLTVLFSTIEIHSKIYMWMKDDAPRYVLIGSANFSNNGLLNDFRESLADMDLRNYKDLKKYYEYIKVNSTPTPKLTNSHSILNITSKFQLSPTGEINTVDLPLYAENKSNGKYVPKSSGLNWGNSVGHTYIRIPIEVINQDHNFFPAFDPEYKSKSKRKRDSDPIEIIWDDDEVMEASSEGIQKGADNREYPKQIASYSTKSKKELGGKSKKSILGRYIRKRMGISDPTHVISYQDLLNYGRDNITFSKISEGVYSANFSNK